MSLCSQRVSMTVLYLFCSLSIVFSSYSAVVDDSITFNKNRYDQFAKNCKFSIPAKILAISHEIPLMHKSNIECLKQLKSSIDTYSETITGYQEKYTHQSIEYLNLEIVKKKLNDEITNVKFKAITAKALFHTFNTIDFNIFDAVNSENDCKNCFKQSYLRSFLTIQQQANELLDTIAWIQGCRQNNCSIVNIPETEIQNSFNAKENSLNASKEIPCRGQDSDDFDDIRFEQVESELNQQKKVTVDIDLDETVKIKTFLNDTLYEFYSKNSTSNNQFTQRKVTSNDPASNPLPQPEKTSPKVTPRPEKNRWWYNSTALTTAGLLMLSSIFFVWHTMKHSEL